MITEQDILDRLSHLRTEINQWYKNNNLTGSEINDLFEEHDFTLGALISENGCIEDENKITQLANYLNNVPNRWRNKYYMEFWRQKHFCPF